MAKLQNVRGTYDLYGEAKRKMTVSYTHLTLPTIA